MSPSSFVWIPHEHPYWWAAFALQLGAGLILFWMERSGLFLLPRRSSLARSRMPGSVLIALVPPIVAYFWIYLAVDAPESAYHLLLLIAFCVLFLRRFVEALWFRRQLSGDLAEVAATSAGYLAFGLTASFLHNATTTTEDTEGWAGSYVTAIGMVFFVMGVVVNTAAHRNLAAGGTLQVPQLLQRLGPWVPGPHYLGEVAAWLGFAILSRHLAVYGFAFMMICLIVARTQAVRDGRPNTSEKIP